MSDGTRTALRGRTANVVADKATMNSGRGVLRVDGLMNSRCRKSSENARGMTASPITYALVCGLLRTVKEKSTTAVFGT